MTSPGCCLAEVQWQMASLSSSLRNGWSNASPTGFPGLGLRLCEGTDPPPKNLAAFFLFLDSEKVSDMSQRTAGLICGICLLGQLRNRGAKLPCPDTSAVGNPAGHGDKMAGDIRTPRHLPHGTSIWLSQGSTWLWVCEGRGVGGGEVEIHKRSSM